MRADPRYGTEISKYALVFRHIQGKRAAQYLRLMVARAAENSDSGSMRAVASNSGPVTFPRIVQAATRLFGLLRILLNFPRSVRVITYSRSLASPNQTGVGTAVPFLRKVESEIYF